MWEGQGDKYAEEAAYMTPRSAVGLTKDDVRTFWNRPLIVVFCDLKLPERIVKLTINRAEAAGQDLEGIKKVLDDHKRDTPRYGAPQPPLPNVQKFNRPEDTFIYPEFVPRVNAWWSKTSAPDRQKLIAHHGTMNAAIRHLVAQRML